MTVEQTVLVAVPRSTSVVDLVRDIVSAGQRAEKADPGDRSDVVRFEQLSTRLEALAEQAIVDGAEYVDLPNALPSGAGFSFEDQLVAGDASRLSTRLPDDVARTVTNWATRATVVELRRALEVGATQVTSEGGTVPEPAEPWQAEGDVSGSRAVEQRFRAQLEAIVSTPDDGLRTRGDAINPSGVNNRVITQVLREFVVGQPGGRVDAPVTYRDGSSASHPFPLRCLALVDHLAEVAPDLELHLALLSIRHTEMDPVVGGAWLRNAEVSRPRPAALTDDFVYETSRTQLRYLSDDGRQRVLLHMYQTGLDTAVVGFYRALVDHLLDHPFSVSVVPMFYASAPQAGPATNEAPFRSGWPWTLGEKP
jgi:hypothetical protein